MLGSLFERCRVTRQDVLQSFSQVTQQVKAIGDLDCMRRALAGGLSIGSGTITADDFRRSMCAEPFCDRLSLSIGQKIDHTAALQITQHSAIAMCFTPRPVIDA